MLILGVLSLLQMTVLPGTVLLRMLRHQPANAVQHWVYTFSLSLLANYVMNSLLFDVWLYRPAAVWTLIALELLLLAFSSGGLAGSLHISLDNTSTDAGGVTDVCASLALAAAFVYAWVWLSDFGNVFTLWDDVVSWDRWAAGWIRHNVEGTGLYPQLMPANWSIAYQLTGNTDVKLFHKALMGLFPLSTILVIADFERFRVLPAGCACLAAFLCSVLMRYLWEFDFILSGYADIASAFFAIAALYALFDWMDRRAHAPAAVDAIFPTAFAAGSMVTKQGGVYILLAVAVLMALHIRSSRLKKSVPAAVLAPAVLGALVVSLPYLIGIAPILLGRQRTNLQLLTQSLHGGRTYPERWLYAWSRMVNWRGPDYNWIAPTVAVCTGLSAFHRLGRNFLLPILVPFYTFWALGFSYELRTMAIVVPFVALAAACGLAMGAKALATIVERGRWFLQAASPPQRWTILAVLGTAGLVVLIVLFVPLDPDTQLSPFLRRLRDVRYGGWVQAQAPYWLYALPAACFAVIWRRATGRTIQFALRPASLLAGFAILVLGLRAYGVTDETLIRRQLELQREVGYKGVNRKLYDMMRRGELHGQIAGNYWHLGFLPDLKQSYVPLQFEPGFSSDWVRSWVALNPKVKYLIFPEEQWSPASRQRMLAGGYHLVFVDTGFCLVAID